MLKLETVQGVRLVRMQAGENRFNLPFVRALAGVLDQVENEPGPLVFSGEGKFFSNGLDIEWMGSAGPSEFGVMMRELDRVMARLLAFPGATAAAINGHAFGAGAIVAACFDYRIMRSDRGYFCFPEVDLGLTMSAGFNAVLQTKYPRASLHEAWITGKRYSGPEAVALGFLHDAVPEDRVVPAAIERVEALAGKNGQSMQALKKQLHQSALDVLSST